MMRIVGEVNVQEDKNRLFLRIHSVRGKTAFCRHGLGPNGNIKIDFRERVCSGGYLVYLARHVAAAASDEV